MKTAFLYHPLGQSNLVLIGIVRMAAKTLRSALWLRSVAERSALLALIRDIPFEILALPGYPPSPRREGSTSFVGLDLLLKLALASAAHGTIKRFAFLHHDLAPFITFGDRDCL